MRSNLVISPTTAADLLVQLIKYCVLNTIIGLLLNNQIFINDINNHIKEYEYHPIQYLITGSEM